MADESGEHRDPSAERSGQPGGDGGQDQAGRASNRRRIMIASLLAPPAVMTLNSRSARAQGSIHPSMSYDPPGKKGHKG